MKKIESKIGISNNMKIENNNSLKNYDSWQEEKHSSVGSKKEKLLKTHPLKITDTTLRDAQQSLIATRMTIEEMVPICDKLDAVGFYSMEIWGGATFDSCLRFLNEDPWERLRTLRKYLPNTKLQMLLRGQNILGYKHYSDDVVTEFIKRAIANGLDIIRIFDALNDIRNMETAFKVVKSEGAHIQGAVCYTISPVHTHDAFVKMAKEMEQMGADSICIKDMAGLISPYEAFALIKAIKEVVSITPSTALSFYQWNGDDGLLKSCRSWSRCGRYSDIFFSSSNLPTCRGTFGGNFEGNSL